MNEKLFDYFFGFAYKYEILDALVVFLGGPIFYILVPLLISFFFVFIKKKKKMYWFSLTFLIVFGSWLVSNLLKSLFKIPRPFERFLDVVPLSFADGFSFPSSHAAVFSAIAVLMYTYNKKTGILFWILAILVSLSRIVQGVHTPVDILFGIGVGSLVAYFFVHLFRRAL